MRVDVYDFARSEVDALAAILDACRLSVMSATALPSSFRRTELLSQLLTVVLSRRLSVAFISTAIRHM